MTYFVCGRYSAGFISLVNSVDSFARAKQSVAWMDSGNFETIEYFIAKPCRKFPGMGTVFTPPRHLIPGRPVLKTSDRFLMAKGAYTHDAWRDYGFLFWPHRPISMRSNDETRQELDRLADVAGIDLSDTERGKAFRHDLCEVVAAGAAALAENDLNRVNRPMTDFRLEQTDRENESIRATVEAAILEYLSKGGKLAVVPDLVVEHQSDPLGSQSVWVHIGKRQHIAGFGMNYPEQE